MKTTTEATTLTPADRELAYAIIGEIMTTPEYGQAVRWIERAGLRPRPTWRTCSVLRVRASMMASTGIVVSTDTMCMALAAKGFTARPIEGEESTNVALRSLPNGDEMIDMGDW